MNSSMDQIRERNLDISQYSESTQVGVSSLKASMRDVASSLSQFKIEREGVADLGLASIEGMKQIQSPGRVYRESEMKAMEAAPEARASV